MLTSFAVLSPRFGSPEVGCRLRSIWSASEGATPQLENFPNRLYMVRIVVPVSAILILSIGGKGMFQNQTLVASVFDFTYLGFERILGKFVT
jgi:hypothetical protein